MQVELQFCNSYFLTQCVFSSSTQTFFETLSFLQQQAPNKLFLCNISKHYITEDKIKFLFSSKDYLMSISNMYVCLYFLFSPGAFFRTMLCHSYGHLGNIHFYINVKRTKIYYHLWKVQIHPFISYYFAFMPCHSSQNQ